MTVCEKCNGSGWDDEHMIKCLQCHGSGEVQMTNEEWIKSLDTEQLAEWLGDAFDLCGAGCSNCFVKELCFDEHNNKMPNDLMCEWLKQPHSEVQE